MCFISSFFFFFFCYTISFLSNWIELDNLFVYFVFNTIHYWSYTKHNIICSILIVVMCSIFFSIFLIQFLGYVIELNNIINYLFFWKCTYMYCVLVTQHLPFSNVPCVQLFFITFPPKRRVFDISTFLPQSPTLYNRQFI